MTPTEYLIMEVLAARYRLGEDGWTFPSMFKTQLKSLEDQGFARFKTGVVQNTQLAWITPKGLNGFLDENYAPYTAE